MAVLQCLFLWLRVQSTFNNEPIFLYIFRWNKTNCLSHHRSFNNNILRQFYNSAHYQIQLKDIKDNCVINVDLIML